MSLIVCDIHIQFICMEFSTFKVILLLIFYIYIYKYYTFCYSMCYLISINSFYVYIFIYFFVSMNIQRSSINYKETIS